MTAAKKLTPQAVAKTAQGYNAKPVPPTCANCKHFSSKTVLRPWMVDANARYKARGERAYYTVRAHGIEGELRCGLGDFAVKKSATCEQFKLGMDGAA